MQNIINLAPCFYILHCYNILRDDETFNILRSPHFMGSDIRHKKLYRGYLLF